jgi:hypothetical protein
VRWGTSISLARSPAVSWNRTRGLICSYSSCSGHSVHCLMLVHSSVRARRSLARSRHLPLPFRDNDACFKRTESFIGLQGFRAFLASLGTRRLPVWSSHLRILCYETVSNSITPLQQASIKGPACVRYRCPSFPVSPTRCTRALRWSLSKRPPGAHRLPDLLRDPMLACSNRPACQTGSRNSNSHY